MNAIIIRTGGKAKAVSSHAIQHARSARGFTLMQLIFVVAIVMILTVIAVPSFLNSSRPMRIRNDANALANLVVMARMRAATEFSRVQVYCTLAPTSGPGFCRLRSTAFPNTANWVTEPQVVYLSPGVSFGIPSSITTALPNQSSTGAYQGDQAQNTPSATNTPVIIFNSRGLPVDALNGTALTADYALYLHDQTGTYYAVAVNMTGRPDLYSFASGAFSLLRE